MIKSKGYDKLKFDNIQQELKGKGVTYFGDDLKLDLETKVMSRLIDGKWVALKMKRIK